MKVTDYYLRTDLTRKIGIRNYSNYALIYAK